jgi:hypothetical protein
LSPDQIGFARRRRPDAHRFVGLAHERHVRIDIRMHRDGADAHLARGADDPPRDLAAIGDEERADHGNTSDRSSRAKSISGR